jgi:hypothetical protein
MDRILYHPSSRLVVEEYVTEVTAKQMMMTEDSGSQLLQFIGSKNQHCRSMYLDQLVFLKTA